MGEPMTAKERSDLQALARMNARVMKADVEAVVADRLLAFELELQREWSAQELQVDDLMIEVNVRVEAINAEITKRCDDQGIRSELRPQMLAGFAPRTYLGQQRVRELRILAKAELDAAGKRAKTEIDRQTAALCGDIIARGLTSAEAQALLAKVEAVETLVPSLDVKLVGAKTVSGD